MNPTIILMATLLWGAVGRSFACVPEGLSARMEAALHGLPEAAPLEVRRLRERSRGQCRLPEAEAEPRPGHACRQRRRVKELQKQIGDLSAKILAVQNVSPTVAAYVNALTYRIETSTSASSKQGIQKDLDQYKQEVATSSIPTGSSRSTTSSNWKKPTTT